MLQFFTHLKRLFVKDLGKLRTDLSALAGNAEALEARYVADINGYLKIISIANAKLEVLKAEQALVTKLKTDLKAL